MTPPAPPAPRPQRDGQSGVTLIEVLVVLAIVAIATGVTLLGVNAADRGARAESEAVRLARHLSLAVDEALIGGQPHALLWDAGGYRFMRWSGSDAGWLEAGLPALAARHDLRPPVALGEADSGQAGIDQTGVDQTGESLIGAGETQALIVAASGTGPAARFGFAGGGAAWVVEFDGFSISARPAALP